MTMLEAGDTLDHYRLEKTVARSGMATLYKATDLRDGRPGGHQGSPCGDGGRPGAGGAVRREQEIGQELDHPGVVKTFDSEQRSRLYMVIEWVEGRLLRAILNEERQAADRASHQPHAANSAMRWTRCTSTAWCIAT